MLKGLYGDVQCPSYEELLADLLTQANTLKSLIVDIWALSDGFNVGSNIVLEAQLGSLRDLHFGNYPYTTSSSVLASGAELGSGLFFNEKPTVTAVVKAFSSSVGNGPFPTAMEDMEALRESATEFGATTGRPRDIGYFDGFATAYGLQLQNANEVALTKLDCLSGYSKLKICTGYERNGTVLEHYPLAEELFNVTPIYETLTGWRDDITGVKKFEDLPEAAQAYVLFIENFVKCRINYVSVGPHRDQLILRS
jgi:adenylosuccinate synthase